MLLSQLPIVLLLLIIAANAQNDEVPEVTDTRTTVSGSITNSELATPTGKYLSVSSTLTVESSSAVSTSYSLSTVNSGSTTRTVTLGTTTIFGIGNSIVGSNSTATGTSTSSSTTPLITLLQGSARASSSISGSSNGTASSTSTTPTATNTTPCNNYAEFCARKYSNITEIAAHNSPFVKTGNAAANQALPVTTQLNDGIRLLQGQMHLVGNIPHFCHTSCDILDAGPITEYLSEVHTWVESHPYDVITILLGNGNYSNPDFYAPFIQQTGLLTYAYRPPKIPMSINDWPTLQEMILKGQRVVFFLDYDTNQTTYPWLLDEFSQIWETPFDPTDRTFPCTAQRPPDLTIPEYKNKLYLLNHNLNYNINILGTSLLVPNIPALNITNNITGYGSLGVSTQQCIEKWGYQPKFLNVDYYNVGSGSVFEVAAMYNNVTYNRDCCGATSTSAAGRVRVTGMTALVAFAVGVLMT